MRKTPKILLAIVALLAFAGAVLSCYLSYSTAAEIGLAGCGGDLLDCDAVLATKWSRWFGLPVSWFGVVCYSLMALGACFALFGKGIGWRFLEATCLLAIGSGLWFVAIQVSSLDSYCLYCLLTHLCGLFGGLIMLWARFASDPYEQGPAQMIGLSSEGPVPTKTSGPPPVGMPTLIATFAIVALIGGQFFSDAPTSRAIEVANLTDAADFDAFGDASTVRGDVEDAGSNPEEAPDIESNESNNEELASAEVESQASKPSRSEPDPPKRKWKGSRKVTLLEGKLILDAYGYPILGSPEAEHIVVEIMDYTCPHCREFHEILHQAIQEQQGKVAVLVLQSPNELLCNPYIEKSRPYNRGACRAAKLAIAVSILEPNAFAGFHDWLLQGERLPTYTSALIEARELVDRQKLRATLLDQSGDLAARVTKNIKLYVAMAKRTNLKLPMQIVGDQAYSGKPKSIEALYEQWEESLGIAPPAVEIPF